MATIENVAEMNVLDELDSILNWIDSCLDAPAENNNLTTVKKKAETEDKCFRPSVPPGHTEYSWSIPEKSMVRYFFSAVPPSLLHTNTFVFKHFGQFFSYRTVEPSEAICVILLVPLK